MKAKILSFGRTLSLKRKAQIQTEIFVYIIAIVIVGLILIFGYNAVKDFGSKSEQVELLSFKKDMEGTFKTVASSYGEIQIKKLKLPVGFEELCFVNLNSRSLTEDDFAFN